jgi:hypothetical protein
MKKTLLAFLFSPLLSTAQKIEENKVDDFTHAKIIRTTWQPIVRKLGASVIAHIRVSKIDDQEYLDLRVMGSGIISINEGDKLMLKTDKDSIITLSNLKYQIACSGCGAVGFAGSALQGLDLKFPMSPDKRDFLIMHKLVKIRLYTSGGYWEDDVKERHSIAFIDALKLIK